jgi:hypothetical protein
MRKHRVLDRVLLIYDELIWRLSANEDFDPAVISDSAKLVQNFIENYHEKSEEDLPVFSRGAPASQPRHNATRAASGWPQGNAQYSRICGAGPQRGRSQSELHQRDAGIRHDCTGRPPRAKTLVVFPKLRDIVSGHEFDAVGEEMEKREHQHFGENGFEKAVAEVTELEKVGLYDPAQFTPKTSGD